MCAISPEFPKQKGFQKEHYEQYKNTVFNQLEVVEAKTKFIANLRAMSCIPGRFGENLSKLSDQDLSLVILALGIAHHFNKRVYIIVDEEDLRYFTSWMKTRPEIMKICAYPLQVEALHSLAFLDSVHRNCALSSQKINEFFSYQSLKQMSRVMLFGTSKGNLISTTYEKIFGFISESCKYKKELQEANK